MNELQGHFFEKVNNIYKPLARLTKIKRNKTNITNIKNETLDISIDPEAIENKVKKYCRQHCSLFANWKKWTNLQKP